MLFHREILGWSIDIIGVQCSYSVHMYIHTHCALAEYMQQIYQPHHQVGDKGGSVTRLHMKFKTMPIKLILVRNYMYVLANKQMFLIENLLKHAKVS